MIITTVGEGGAVAAVPARPGIGGFSVPAGVPEQARAAAPGVPGASALTPAPAAPAHASSLDAMLAMQEAHSVEVESDAARPGTVRDREARRRGNGLLAALAALQHALLADHDPEAALRLLAGLLDGPPAADPQLEGAVRALSLRAAIELARRGL